ncbi:MAG: type II CAAX endopeptidase family protein [bacterium]|jgi:membrane protease YdiL (CAAX protease family)
MKANLISPRELGERIVLALFFIAAGFLIFTKFSPYGPKPTGIGSYLGRIILIAGLLLIAFILKRSSYKKYWLVPYGLFIMALAVTLDWIFGRFLVDTLNITTDSPRVNALMKLNEAVLIIVVILFFTRVSGSSFGSIYVQWGNRKWGIIIGLTTFILSVAVSGLGAKYLFMAQNLTLERVVPWIPWLLIYVLSNGAMEELLFRGLFLQKLEPFFGKLLSNILIAFVFTSLHSFANYTSEMTIFIAVVTLLAILWGYIMQKTSSALASILFHAGMDVSIMLGMFSNL